MGGLLRESFKRNRIPGDPLIKNKICGWVLEHFGTSVTDPEYDKYVPKFLILDQEGIDKWLDEDQRRLNIEQLAIDHQNEVAE